MGKIVLEIEEFGKTYSEYKSFDQDCIRIGRGFHNDLIINDPFVGASHISLKFAEGSWSCENNSSLNGTFVSTLQEGGSKVKVDHVCPISSGGTIFLGKTTIHVWDIDHPVAPEQALEARSSSWFDPRKTTKSFIFNLGAFCFVYYMYLSQLSWRRDESFFEGIAATSILLFCLVVWSALWALITRFTKRQHRFLLHLIFSFQWAILSLALSFTFKFVLFFICNYDFYYVVSLLVFGLFSIFVLNVHLAIGTNLSFIKRTVISSLIAFSIILFSLLGYYATHIEFSPDPHHYISLVPVPKKWVPAIPIDQELKRLDSIF